MITIREIQGDEEKYNWWLTIMPDVLLNVTLLPKLIRTKLDFSIDSLDILENYMKENFELKAILQSNQGKRMIDFLSIFLQKYQILFGLMFLLKIQIGRIFVF